MATGERHISEEQFQYIARISHGKDSMKMLDVIFTHGLPLDRITTTDVWATDTIRGEHPKMVAFKDMADEYIWRKYRIEVEHLCAMRNGEKVTYEKMFYHVPVRRSQTVQVERERERERRLRQGAVLGFPDLWNPWCQSYLKVRGIAEGFPSSERGMVSEAQAYMGSRSPCRGKASGARSSRSGFWTAPPRGAGEISWNIWESQQTSLPVLAS